MSQKLSFKEALARQADVTEESRDSSGFRAEVGKTRFVLRAPKITQPVQVARTLATLGMSLRKAHGALDRLAQTKIAIVELNSDDPDAVAEKLGPLGLAIAPAALPSPDIKKIREKFGASQSEFAIQFGLELETLRNWEQGRNQPDPAARLLLKVIEIYPAVVEAVLFRQALAHEDVGEGESRRSSNRHAWGWARFTTNLAPQPSGRFVEPWVVSASQGVSS